MAMPDSAWCPGGRTMAAAQRARPVATATAASTLAPAARLQIVYHDILTLEKRYASGSAASSPCWRLPLGCRSAKRECYKFGMAAATGRDSSMHADCIGDEQQGCIQHCQEGQDWQDLGSGRDTAARQYFSRRRWRRRRRQAPGSQRCVAVGVGVGREVDDPRRSLLQVCQAAMCFAANCKPRGQRHVAVCISGVS